MSDQDIPSGAAADDSYAEAGGITGNDPVPVVKDDETVESVVSAPEEFEGGEDSDEQLAKDDTEAIDEGNIIQDRTRGAQPEGSYKEPGDDEGLPGPEDGTSATA